MSSRIQKKSITFSTSGCLTEPYAFSRSNQMTWSSADLLSRATFIFSHNMDACSKQPGKPGIPAFWFEILINLLFNKNLTILSAMTPKKIFLSKLSHEIGRNCSRCLEFFSFGIYISSANPQSSAIIFFNNARYLIFIYISTYRYIICLIYIYI